MNLEDQVRFFAVLLIFMLGVIGGLLVILDSAPSRYCEAWGGTLYEGNNCFLIKDMDKCLANDGSVMEKFQYNQMNWSG